MDQKSITNLYKKKIKNADSEEFMHIIWQMTPNSKQMLEFRQ